MKRGQKTEGNHRKADIPSAIDIHTFVCGTEKSDYYSIMSSECA